MDKQEESEKETMRMRKKQLVIVGEVGRGERGMSVTLRRQGEATAVSLSFNERRKE